MKSPCSCINCFQTVNFKISLKQKQKKKTAKISFNQFYPRQEQKLEKKLNPFTSWPFATRHNREIKTHVSGKRQTAEVTT